MATIAIIVAQNTIANTQYQIATLISSPYLIMNGNSSGDTSGSVDGSGSGSKVLIGRIGVHEGGLFSSIIPIWGRGIFASSFWCINLIMRNGSLSCLAGLFRDGLIGLGTGLTGLCIGLGGGCGVYGLVDKVISEWGT